MTRPIFISVALIALTACLPPEGGLTEDDVAGFWQLREGAARGEDLPSAEGHRVTLRLDVDGNLGGTAACNSYFGTYDLVASIFDLGAEIGMTAEACRPNVMAVESAYVEALRLIDSAALTDDGRLHLIGEEASLFFDPLAEVDVAQMAGRWAITEFGRDDLRTSTSGEPFAEFTPDGQLTAHTGCRTLTGRYVISGDEVLMTETAAQGQCAAALAGQDAEIVAVLADGFVPQREGGTLVLHTPAGLFLVLEAA